MAEKQEVKQETWTDADGLLVWNDDALTPPERELLSYYEQTFLLHEVIPSLERCVKEGFDSKVVVSARHKKKFREALQNRGIEPVYHPNTDPTKGPVGALMVPASRGEFASLTPEQLMVANILLDFRDKRSNSKKLAECGITTAKYNGWLKDPVFKNYVTKRSEQLFGENQNEINGALLSRARSGDIGAIKYANQMTGYFDPDKREVTDVNMVLMTVLEILTEELSTSPELLGRVAERLVTLADRAAPVGTKLIAGTASKPVYEGETVKKVSIFDQWTEADLADFDSTGSGF